MADKERESKKNGRLLRVLKLVAKIDWRGMALVLGALGGCTGAVWNQVDAWVRQAHEERTQSGTYELLAQRLDELYERIEVCEITHEPAEASLKEPPDSARSKPKPKPLEAVSAPSPSLPAPPHTDEAAMVKTIMEGAPEPEPVAYKRSRLPSFDVIRQKARQLEDMEGFMEDMKAR